MKLRAQFAGALFACTALVQLAGWALAQAPAARKPVAPLTPAELIKLLPLAPAGWSLKESKATSFYSDWLISQATRQLEAPPLSGAAPSVAAPATPIQMTRIRLTDTGHYPVLAADFEGFRPGKYGTMESLYIGGLPARRAILHDGERLRVLVNNRFIVEIEVHNQRADAAMNWLQLFDVRRLVSAPETATDKLPNPIRVNSVDELNPKANRSFELSWSTAEDLEAARNRAR